MAFSLPKLIVHADWGTDPGKRILATAALEGESYRAEATRRAPADLLAGLRDQAEGGSALAGFDFPIGLPWAYAQQAGIQNFRDFLARLSPEDPFFSPAAFQGEIDFDRPFYPAKPGGTKQAHLVDGLKVPDIDSLRRVCEWQTKDRRAACPLFWTLGGNQVGKGALSGWKEELLPALRHPGLDLKIWPFDGPLGDLLAGDRVAVVETYPGEVYHWFSLPMGKAGKSKRNPAHRKECRTMLLAATDDLNVELTECLRFEIENGFGDAEKGEDSFDAFVGLLGMIAIVRGERKTELPRDDRILRVEGWILGQEPGPVSTDSDRLHPLDLQEKTRQPKRSGGVRPSSHERAGKDAGGPG